MCHSCNACLEDVSTVFTLFMIPLCGIGAHNIMRRSQATQLQRPLLLSRCSPCAFQFMYSHTCIAMQVCPGFWNIRGCVVDRAMKDMVWSSVRVLVVFPQL